jgi:hypothetical protein
MKMTMAILSERKATLFYLSLLIFLLSVFVSFFPSGLRASLCSKALM